MKKLQQITLNGYFTVTIHRICSGYFTSGENRL